MYDLDNIGADWIIDEVENLTDDVKNIKPSEFNEESRYLPESVTPLPGFIRFDVNPFMREIVDCFDVNSPVREVNIKKGAQITYTTVLESITLYYMAHIKTLPIMYITADKELSKSRVENNFLPMLNHSGLDHIITSSDTKNMRKTGKTASHLQFEGGGYFVPFGAKNADKMRSYSICIMLKDELDAWPQIVGKDGDPDALTDDRCSAFWERRKIFRGATPLVFGLSKIEPAYLRGDQRKYKVLCKACGFPQELRWSTTDKETGIVGGFDWETENGILIHESVCYRCQNCGEPHFEYDKENLFSPDYGAHWEPTATPQEPNIRSYHLPGFYSPKGMQPWYKCVSDYIQGFSRENNRVIDINKYRVFYNNILAEPWKEQGSQVSFRKVSGHRRSVYRLGEIPNKYAERWSGSHVLFLTCQVDVHKTFLAVGIFGWCKDSKCYLIDYYRLEPKENEGIYCDDINCSVWGELQKIIDKEFLYVADDEAKYRLIMTLIDAGYANATVTTFCEQWDAGVYPVIGRDKPGKNQKIEAFRRYDTKTGIGWQITVDYYKDRLAPVLRREWFEDLGEQDVFHFNAPVDILDKPLAELTAESRREKIDKRGQVLYEWHRPSNKRNELWDLLVYGHAAVEILAYLIFTEILNQKTVDMAEFWEYIAQN